MADERRVEAAQAEAGQVELGDFQVLLLLADGDHGAIQVLGILHAEARRGMARGGGHEVVAGRRGQLHHVVAGAVVQALEKLHLAAAVVPAGAGNDEDQRCGTGLAGQAIAQALDRPEVGRQPGFALGQQVEAVVTLIDILVAGQRRAQLRRGAGDGGLERVADGKAIAGRHSAVCHGHQAQTAGAGQGHQAQEKGHGDPP